MLAVGAGGKERFQLSSFTLRSLDEECMSSAVYISSLAFTPAIVAAVDSWGEKIGGHEIAKNVYTSGHGGGSYVYLKY